MTGQKIRILLIVAGLLGVANGNGPGVPDANRPRVIHFASRGQRIVLFLPGPLADINDPNLHLLPEIRQMLERSRIRRRWPDGPPMPPDIFWHRPGRLDPNVVIRPWPFEPNDWPDIEQGLDSTSDPNATAPNPWMGQDQIDRAVQWAMSMVGKRYDHTQRYNKGGYYYACLGLVYDAYVKTGTAVEGGYGTAHGAAMALDARRNRRFVPPAKGAWVFYDTLPYGHVALSIGDGKVIHVRTDTAARQAQIKIEHYLGPGHYIGWAWPEPVRRPPALRDNRPMTRTVPGRSRRANQR